MNFKTQFQALLQQTLPGETVQWQMAHLKREKVALNSLHSLNARQSAVMILICEDALGQFFIPLTQRFEYNGVHSKQISLPGGKFEEEDANLEATAVRECREEIGVKASIELLRPLTSVYIPVSNFLVQPYLAYYAFSPPDLTPQANEVEHILKLYLNDLMNDSIVKETVVEPMPGYTLKTPYFEVEGRVVWGATAMILNELKAMLKQI